MAKDRQRLDKWLWFARVVKSRTLAARLVADGHVRLNGQRVISPAHPAGIGDVLTLALDRRARVLRLVGIGARRGPSRDARLLFDDLSAPGRPVAAPPDGDVATLEAIHPGADTLAMPRRSD